MPGLQSAAEGYLALASHMSKVVPYELPQVIAQISPPPMDVPMPIRKTLINRWRKQNCQLSSLWRI